MCQNVKCGNVLSHIDLPTFPSRYAAILSIKVDERLQHPIDKTKFHFGRPDGEVDVGSL